MHSFYNVNELILLFVGVILCYVIFKYITISLVVWYVSISVVKRYPNSRHMWEDNRVSS